MASFPGTRPAKVVDLRPELWLDPAQFEQGHGRRDQVETDAGFPFSES